jgi:glycosyltransferase involved in cell wall biosynthesis
VVSDLPWVHELIEPGRHALVVPVDESATAAAMLRLIRDPGQRGQISQEGRGLVERHRNQELEMRRLSALYRDLATSPDRWPLRRRLNGVPEPRR